MARLEAKKTKKATTTKQTTIGFDTVRAMGLALPEAEEGTIYGSPALRVHGQMFACLAIHRSAERDTLVVRIAFDHRDELMAADPETYYLTDHYVDYPCILVRLARVHPDALRDLLRMGWQFVSSRQGRGRPRRKKRPRASR
jgi:hypothetical protein